MKYRLTRDDGAEIDVPGVVWESTLERAFRNGWKPAGTDAPWAPRSRSAGAKSSTRATTSDARGRQGGRWPESDYFSASSQYVRESDALELGTAVIDMQSSDARDPTGIQRVGAFVRRGGFTIGRAPEGPSAVRAVERPSG